MSLSFHHGACVQHYSTYQVCISGLLSSSVYTNSKFGGGGRGAGCLSLEEVVRADGVVQHAQWQLGMVSRRLAKFVGVVHINQFTEEAQTVTLIAGFIGCEAAEQEEHRAGMYTYCEIGLQVA